MENVSAAAMLRNDGQLGQVHPFGWDDGKAVGDSYRPDSGLVCVRSFSHPCRSSAERDIHSISTPVRKMSIIAQSRADVEGLYLSRRTNWSHAQVPMAFTRACSERFSTP